MRLGVTRITRALWAVAVLLAAECARVVYRMEIVAELLGRHWPAAPLPVPSPPLLAECSVADDRLKRRAQQILVRRMSTLRVICAPRRRSLRPRPPSLVMHRHPSLRLYRSNHAPLLQNAGARAGGTWWDRRQSYGDRRTVQQLALVCNAREQLGGQVGWRQFGQIAHAEAAHLGLMRASQNVGCRVRKRANSASRLSELPARRHEHLRNFIPNHINLTSHPPVRHAALIDAKEVQILEVERAAVTARSEKGKPIPSLGSAVCPHRRDYLPLPCA